MLIASMDSIGYLLTKAFYAEVEQNETMQLGVTAHHHSLYTWICELRNRSTGEVLDLPIRYTMKMAFIGSDKTLKKCIDDLSDWGIIEVLVRGANQYQTTKVKLAVAFLRKHCESTTTAVRQQHKRGVADLRQQYDSSATAPRTTKTNKTDKTKKTNNPPETPDGISGIEPVPTFETFWNLYGKKEDRKKCQQKWDKLSSEIKHAIIAHLPGYIQKKPDPQFRKNPSTYLNNECWRDEPLTPTQLTSSLALFNQAPNPTVNRSRR